ncbi:aminotransferase class I/II-fold pyridoxal phosphate-dependent enzyme [Catellatospora sp. KI3]|uniref:aminotransferase class I/II-fold pyridoxal phosphate-dependent enzyme n=1 Tax=Catellatospora sp. KI3 TaxID=3041620 RepID=UPI00248253C9|nr:aminotransferase class I/II-fold pyridoxal phosphate-dependent enzyme [Catellatospora sp. KI3]MDI1465899.1 aminotransferase class I/II-fold pyridoxal phosphate-dependent enzyme [Catellatospora sp. KI3]
MVSQQSARLVAGTPAIAVAHFAAEADPYHPGTNPRGYVNLGTAENRLLWDLLAPRLRAARPVEAADTRYAPLHGTARLRENVARFLAATRGVPVDPEDLVIVSGATGALDVIATALCDPGEAIVVPVPYYGALDTDLTGRSGAVLVPVAPGPGDGLTPGPAAVAEAVRRARDRGVTVRALAITSPHNPLGRVYPAGELTALARVCAGLDLDLVADEIYANSVFGSTPFTSALDLTGDLIDPDRVHVVWGFAKDFGLPGLKVGVLHTRGARVRDAVRELAYFAPVSTDTQWLLADLLDDKGWLADFLDEHRRRLSASYTRVTAELTAAGLAFAPAQAGFSVWTSLRPWLARDDAAGERELWRRLVDGARVSLTPGEVFHATEPGWFRLCHTVGADAVTEGVRRIRQLLG